MAMRIIFTRCSEEQARADYAKLQELHAKALLDEPTWSLFGGVLTVDGRTYQVVEDVRGNSLTVTRRY